MRQLTYVEPNVLEWREVEAPQLTGDAQAIVTPLAVASCDLDKAIIRGIAPFPGPFAIGHEFIAQVAEAGDAVTSFAPGDRVVVPFQISCGECEACRRGLRTHCRSGGMYGIGAAGGDYGGALADRVRVPFADAMLLPLPDGVEPVVAASAPDNVADAWRAVAAPLRERGPGSVLVLAGRGANSIALYAVQIAHACNADAVDVLTTDARTAERARALGAGVSEVGAWPESHGRYDVVVEYANDPRGLACALRSTRGGGICTSTSMHFGGSAEIPILEMYMRGVTLTTGRADSRTLLPEVLELIVSGRLDPGRVTSEVAAWEDAADALLGYTTKLVVERGGEPVRTPAV